MQALKQAQLAAILHAQTQENVNDQVALVKHTGLNTARHVPQSLTHGSASEGNSMKAAIGEETWIQKLYRKFHNSTICKTTQFEIAERGF